MSATVPVIRKHHATAREHLAGVKAAREFQQELIAAHLLRTPDPISEQPITTKGLTAP